MNDAPFRVFLAKLIEPQSFRQQAAALSARHGLSISLAISECPAFKAWVKKAIDDVSGIKPRKQ